MSPTANTATAAVPWTAPKITCPLFQYNLSTTMIKNTQKEYCTISFNKGMSKELHLMLTFNFLMQYHTLANKYTMFNTVIKITNAIDLYPMINNGIMINGCNNVLPNCNPL